MRLLYFTDTHIRGTSPRSRTDDFQEAIRRKIEEVVGIAGREQADFILHGGDVFDRPNLSPAIVREFAALFRRFRVPVYAVAGNHDIYGHNPDTVDRTMLGLLDAFGTLTLLREGDRVKLEKGGLTVQLSGQPFHYDLDKRDRQLDYAVKNETGADFVIHMVHGMLVDRALPEGVPHTMVHEVWSEDVDILLTGHYHAGFPLQHRDGKYIVNPGALARINSHRSEIERMPQAVLIDLDRNRGIDIRFIPLSCAMPGDEVLDRSYIETAVFRQEQLRSFIQTIHSNTEFRALDVRDIIDEISRLEGIGDEVKYEALRRIAIEQEAEGEKVW